VEKLKSKWSTAMTTPRPRKSELASVKPVCPDPTSTGYKVLHTPTGEPLTNLYQRLHETAVDLVQSTRSPSNWPDLIAYLLESMENLEGEHHALESALDDTCRLITRRLNKGKW
jgi:hypothetical protein